MPRFGPHSRKILEELDPRLKLVMLQAIRFFDFTLLEGHRGEQRQNDLYEKDLSHVRFPGSKHNSKPSKAVDVAQWFPEEPHIRWADKESFIYLAGFIMAIAAIQGVPLRWGGDWNMDNDQQDEDWRDLGHFELNE